MNERLNRRHALMNTDRLALFHVKPGVNRVVRQGLTCLHNACARPPKAASCPALLAHSLMLRKLRHAFGVHCVPIQIVDVQNARKRRRLKRLGSVLHGRHAPSVSAEATTVSPVKRGPGMCRHPV